MLKCPGEWGVGVEEVTGVRVGATNGGNLGTERTRMRCSAFMLSVDFDGEFGVLLSGPTLHRTPGH